MTAALPDQVHEWLSFEDPDEQRTWVFDLTFLTSRWTCIFGRGCPGVLSEPAPDMQEGCCSYGAHFTDENDVKRVDRHARKLKASEWQFKAEATRRGGPTKRKGTEVSTRLVDGACIFLNRPGFAGGAGCALHQAALARGERPLDWKPDVCWQLPLRRIDDADTYGHVTSTVREWKRRDWGPGGHEFHWWCTDGPGEGAGASSAGGSSNAFVGHQAVYQELRDELVELVGQKPYDLFVQLVRSRQKMTPLPHPALRRGR